MKIIEFYTSFLKSQGYGFDGDLLTVDGDQPAEFTYNKVKRRLALPTPAMIKQGLEDAEGRECHAFHPLCESILSGESGTIRFLKNSIRTNLFLRNFELIDAILETAAAGKSVRLAGYKKFMSDIICEGMKEPTFDDRLVKSWETVKAYVYNLLEKDKKYKVTNIFISPSMEIDGAKFHRVANYKHMFEEESLDGTATYFGAKLQRKQDKVIIHRLLSTLFGWYPSVVGSNDSRPYFGCLARGWAQYVVNYNLVVKGLRDHTHLKTLDDEWISQLDNMEVYDNVIQTLPYNTGPRSDTPEKDTSAHDFRLDRQPAGQQIPMKKASDTAKAPELDDDDPVAFFRKRAAVTNDQNPLKNLSPALQRMYEEKGNINLDKPEVAKVSLVDAFGGKKEEKSLSLLGNSGGLGGGGLGSLDGGLGGGLGGGMGGGLGGSSGGLGSLLGGSGGSFSSAFSRA
ncbi:hypothetical protein ASESINO_49 [Erwinia phage vB_EamM_Asesino]|uniref:Uncharacterized protein n=1 Tax=Erwinia phage vB_EamM_Asesino TaxID=1883370 RepID=A0A1B2I9Y5_9CAUD|nr:hypothetical protein ASESINO_49 [Erwinia phage vB_EamM_Asesino]ANZ48062.1 hypothetical protein ASESINO_49 [Erwinia phage vB_EamM_Asesino]